MGVVDFDWNERCKTGGQCRQTVRFVGRSLCELGVGTARWGVEEGRRRTRTRLDSGRWCIVDRRVALRRIAVSGVSKKKCGCWRTPTFFLFLAFVKCKTPVNKPGERPVSQRQKSSTHRHGIHASPFCNADGFRFGYGGRS